MKIKSLIKLICTVVIVAALAVWAFGANVTLFGKKFIPWGENMFKGSDTGYAQAMVLTFAAPDGVENFDAHLAAVNAVPVLEKRAQAIGYEGAQVRAMGKDSVTVTLPLSELQMKGGAELFQYNGKLEVSHSGEVVFTNADVKGARITGVNETATGYVVEVTLNEDARARLKELTSNGSYTFDFTVDELVEVSLSGSDAIKNGKMTVEFTTSEETEMAIFDYILNSGAIDGTVTLAESRLVNGTAGANAMAVLGVAALAVMVLAAVYFIISNRVLGVAAALSTLIALLFVEFFAATFSWLVVDAAAVAGLLVSLLLIVGAHMIVINGISRQYAAGKDVISSIDTGIGDVRKFIIEIGAVVLAVGLGLWMCGGQPVSFGIAIMAGGVACAVTALLVFRFVLKTFIGLGWDSSKALGLKRGE